MVQIDRNNLEQRGYFLSKEGRKLILFNALFYIDYFSYKTGNKIYLQTSEWYYYMVLAIIKPDFTWLF